MRSNRIRRVAHWLPIVLALGATVGPAAARSELGPAVRVSTDATAMDGYARARPYSPSIAITPAGRRLVAWSEPREDGKDYRAWARVLGPDGEPIAPAFALSPDELGSERVEAHSVQVAAHGTREEFLATWIQAAGDRWGMVGQRLRGDGVALGSPFIIVSQRRFAYAGGAAIAWSPRDREFLVVWEGMAGPEGTEVYGARVSDTGSGASRPFQISSMGASSDSEFDARNPSIAANGRTGGYLVAWDGSDDRSESWWHREVYLRVVPGDATAKMPAPRRLSARAYHAFPAPDLAYSPALREFVVVWNAPANEETGLWARRIRSSGRPRGAAKLLAPDPMDVYHARVEPRGRGWMLGISGTTDTGYGSTPPAPGSVWLRRMRADLRVGALQSGTEGHEAYGPALASSPDGTYVGFAWVEGDRPTPRTGPSYWPPPSPDEFPLFDVFARRL